MTDAKHEAPEPFGSIIDNTTEADAEWFACHPFSDERWRPMIDGEFWPERFKDGGRVLVRQIRPGARTRLPFGVLVEPFDPKVAALVREHAADAPSELLPDWLRDD